MKKKVEYYTVIMRTEGQGFFVGAYLLRKRDDQRLLKLGNRDVDLILEGREIPPYALEIYRFDDAPQYPKLFQAVDDVDIFPER